MKDSFRRRDTKFAKSKSLLIFSYLCIDLWIATQVKSNIYPTSLTCKHTKCHRILTAEGAFLNVTWLKVIPEPISNKSRQRGARKTPPPMLRRRDSNPYLQIERKKGRGGYVKQWREGQENRWRGPDAVRRVQSSGVEYNLRGRMRRGTTLNKRHPLD